MRKLDWSSVGRGIWAFYHPFYGTPDGPSGRWLTWNEPVGLSTGYGFPEPRVPEEMRACLRRDPGRMVGPGRRDSYSVFYPTLGLYDTRDPEVLKQHVLWALEAGIDGFLWDCTIPNGEVVHQPIAHTHFFKSLEAMVEVLDELRVEFKLCPWYDSYGWWGYPVERMVAEISELVRRFGDSPHFLRMDGSFCVFTYKTFGSHTWEDWRRVREGLEAEGMKGIAIVAGEAARPGVGRLFEGLTQYNVPVDRWTPEGFASCYEDIVRVARKEDLFYALPVAPGFDGRCWHIPGRVASRGLGRLYEAIWEKAMAYDPPFIVICSWNEWGEGTQIEPCEEYEDLYIRLTRRWAERFKEKGGRR